MPDINARPNSRRKINLPNKNSTTLSSFDSVIKPNEKTMTKVVEDLGSTNLNLYKTESNKEKEAPKLMTATTKGSDSLSKTGGLGTGKVVLKRGLSKSKK